MCHVFTSPGPPDRFAPRICPPLNHSASLRLLFHTMGSTYPYCGHRVGVREWVRHHPLYRPQPSRRRSGVGFGGFRLSASNRNLVAFLQDLGLGHGHGSRRASPEAEGDSSTPKEGIAGETVAEKSATASVRRIHVIDVHTGLGPPGSEALYSSFPPYAPSPGRRILDTSN